MEEIEKINSTRLYLFWKNISTGLLVIAVVIALARILPGYWAPIWGLVGAAFLYGQLHRNRKRHEESCMVITYSFFFVLLSYSFVSIIFNVVWIWGLIPQKMLPKELVFFNEPYMPTLYMLPCGFLVLIFINSQRHRLRLCVECRIKNGNMFDRGGLGRLYSYEAHFQLKNLIGLFGVLSVLVWGYYLLIYNNIAVNGRDWYMFVWLTVIGFVMEEVYFIFRYFNLYLDLKENGELITQDEVNEMTATTFVRYYVISGEKVYLNTHVIDPKVPYREVIDTPFSARYRYNDVNLTQIRQMAKEMTGLDGELRFFYGRSTADLEEKQSLLRYFYFVDETASLTKLNDEGEWVDFSELKKLYNDNINRLAPVYAADVTRLATIMLTHKIFNEQGYRKNKLRSYRPSFTLQDVKQSQVDFQDDKWIRISLFNSDTSFYRLKKWWRGVRGKDSHTRMMD